MRDMWDYIIVGAGSAGCAVARRLADAGFSVLLLEAGGNDRSWKIAIPAAIGFADLSACEWGLRSDPDTTRFGKAEIWKRGRVLGGSSSINGMNYVRGNHASFDRWAEMGNRGWDARSTMQIYRDLEACDPVSIVDCAGVRGRSGPVHVRQVKYPHRLTRDFLTAAQSAGFNFNPDYNGLKQEGVGYSQLTQRGRRRWSAMDAFLRTDVPRSLCILAESQVERITLDNFKATGVVYRRHGEIHSALSGGVILCAGSIGTPQLLMLSGVGDGAHLNSLGIPVSLDNSSVGDGLMEHPLVTMTYAVKGSSYNPSNNPIHNLGLLLKYVWRRGPLASIFEGMGFLRTDPSLSEPDIQIHFAPLGLNFTEDSGGPMFLRRPSVSIWINKSFPLSRSRVRLRSADANEHPRIEARLLEREEDALTLVEGIKLVRRIMAAQPMAANVERELRPGFGCSDNDAIRDFVTRATSLAYHFAGTCRMGADDASVVYPDLRVRGVENLWIADASVIPAMISGNTNAVSMAIGDKLGRQLAKRRSNAAGVVTE